MAGLGEAQCPNGLNLGCLGAQMLQHKGSFSQKWFQGLTPSLQTTMFKLNIWVLNHLSETICKKTPSLRLNLCRDSSHVAKDRFKRSKSLNRLNRQVVLGGVLRGELIVLDCLHSSAYGLFYLKRSHTPLKGTHVDPLKDPKEDLSTDPLKDPVSDPLRQMHPELLLGVRIRGTFGDLDPLNKVLL